MVRILRFGSLFLATLVFAPVYAHLLELPGRRVMDGPTWLGVQHTLYGGYAISGAIFEPTALVVFLATAYALRHHRARMGLHLLAASCVAGMLLVFALGNNPINQHFAAWTPGTLPPDWTSYRDRWELYHATSCALATIALVALLVATLRELRATEAGGVVPDRGAATQASATLYRRQVDPPYRPQSLRTP